MENFEGFSCMDKAAPLLITGSAGFMGKNLAARLRAEGYEHLLLFDVASPEGTLEDYARQAAFVFHLAGVNRPKKTDDFYTGNTDLTGRLLSLLKETGNATPVLLSSSAQAGNGTDYAKSKEAAEANLAAYAAETGAKTYLYRLPGVFGKWSRPDYNSVVATFCHNIARDKPIEVRDPGFSLPLCYIDDVVESFLSAMNGQQKSTGAGGTLGIEPTYEVTLGWLAGIIHSFRHSRESLAVPDMGDECTRKLYATYLSFLPENELSYPLVSHVDERGSFTEFIRTQNHGQVSINVAKPGVVKGNHWHDTKNEKFLVVQGEAVIRFRQLMSETVVEYRVSGAKPEVVDIPTGTTHNIENVGNGDLITVMWASESFDQNRPDTYFEEV